MTTELRPVELPSADAAAATSRPSAPGASANPGHAARPGAGPATTPGARPGAKPGAKPGGRPGSEKRRPIHLGAVVGISASVYAVSLAAVTGLQSAHDQALVHDAQPATSGVAALRAAHDKLTGDLQRASQDYTAAATGYQKLAAQVGKLDQQVAGLAGSVKGISSGTQSLSGSSSGGLSTVYVSSGGLPSVGAAPRPVAAPPANACTTPSGKPC